MPASTSGNDESVAVRDRCDLDYERYLDWELFMCLELGFSPEQAEGLCAIRNFTWHDACDLLHKGKTHEQVVWLLDGLPYTASEEGEEHE
jgi:hypothetical protein